MRNWLFGWYIVEFEQGGQERTELYGKKLIDILSARLTQSAISGISPTSLRKFREFYQCYAKIQQTVSVESQISQVVSGALPVKVLDNQMIMPLLAEYFNLSWSHYVVLLSIKSADERRFYEIEAIQNAWSIRELKRQISASLYERLALSRDKDQVKDQVKALAHKGQLVAQPTDVLKSPYVLEFLGLQEADTYTEHELETAIINKIEQFLLELGKGFLFESRQKRFTFDDDHFYVDLDFYNRLLRSYVLVYLKRDKLTHQDLGQMQMYVNYFDRHVKVEAENPQGHLIKKYMKS